MGHRSNHQHLIGHPLQLEFTSAFSAYPQRTLQRKQHNPVWYYWFVRWRVAQRDTWWQIAGHPSPQRWNDLSKSSVLGQLRALVWVHYARMGSAWYIFDFKIDWKTDNIRVILALHYQRHAQRDENSIWLPSASILPCTWTGSRTRKASSHLVQLIRGRHTVANYSYVHDGSASAFLEIVQSLLRSQSTRKDRLI